ncbi:hypothetical protein EDC04DRAFT_2895593 [Pisolithus marmoratus]|nr:hypothetical protein EDC04DRAFT_2895593 [Pisolithus marmoratus]
MEWFAEEWSQIQKASEGAGDDLAHELDCRASALAALGLLWQKQLREFPGLPNIDEGERLDDLDLEDEEELDEMLDDELLYVAEEFALADEYHQEFSDMASTKLPWDDEWEFDVLDMDPQSSPSKRHCR